MPRNYIRKTNRQSWSEERMRKAILDVATGICGFRKASQVHGVPKSTLEYRVKRYRDENDLDGASRKGLGRFRSVFSLEHEQIILQHIKYLRQQLFHFTQLDIRRLAYEMATLHDIQNNFNDETKVAGKDWLYSFFNRHDRAMLCTNSSSMSHFFDVLEELIQENKIMPDRIYNVGEIGITTAANSRSEIVTMKNSKKTTGHNEYADREKVTTILCFSSSGHYVPPLFIFPRVRMKAELLVGFPTDSVVVCHSTGAIQNETFVEWLEHFVSHVHPSKEQPVLLLLDGSASYTKTLRFIELAQNNGILLLSCPIEAIQKLLPLNVDFVGQLITHYSQEVDNWLKNNMGCEITQYQIAELFGSAYLATATSFNAVDAFKNAGIVPLNRDIHNDDYGPSEITKWLLAQAEQNLSLIKNEDNLNLSLPC